MAFVLIQPAAANGIISRNRVTAEEIPSYGLIVYDAGRHYLVFRKTTGEILVIDVTGAVPAHFSQKLPAVPENFLAGWYAEIVNTLRRYKEDLAPAFDWLTAVLVLGVVVYVAVKASK
jgi:hypothetical protein